MTFAPGRQSVLFPLDGFLTSNTHPIYDVSQDDKTFVMLRSTASDEVPRLILVQNFFEELKARVPN